MNRRPDLRWKRVVDRLRRDDPGSIERPLDAEEQRDIRRRMLTHLGERHTVPRWPRTWQLAASGSLIVVAGFVWWGLESSQDASRRDEAVVQAAEGGPGSPTSTLELRFAAPEGTQLVWILQTDRED